MLEALTTSNYLQLDEESAALVQIAQSPPWGELKTPELRAQAERFLSEVARLRSAVDQHDLDSAATSYGALITSCYQCHRRLKDLRIAERPAPR